MESSSHNAEKKVSKLFGESASSLFPNGIAPNTITSPSPRRRLHTASAVLKGN